MKKQLISTILIICFLAGLTGCAGRENKTKILRFGLEVAPDNGSAKIAEEIADDVYKRTNGSVKIEVYPSGQLGTQRDYIESAMLGIIDIGYTSLAGL